MANNYTANILERQPSPTRQDSHHGSTSPITSVRAPLPLPPTTPNVFVNCTFANPTRCLEFQLHLPPVMNNMPYLPTSHVSSLRQQPPGVTPLYYQWQDVAGTAGSASTRSLAPVLESNDEGASAVHRRASSVPAGSPAPTSFHAIQGHGDGSFQEIGHSSISQQVWNEASSKASQSGAAFQNIPMPKHRSDLREKQESIGQSSSPQLETVGTTNQWPLLPQEKAKARNWNSTSSSHVLRNTTDTEAAAVTYLRTKVELSLKTYASAILSLAAPSAPPLVTPVMEATAAGNAKELQELNTKKSLGATDGPKVIQDQKPKDTLGATDGPKNVSRGSGNKYPLEPDSFFYNADIDVLINYVGNVRPQSRMKYTENFVRPRMASAYSHKSIYDKNHPEDLPSKLPVSDMYVLEQRLKNGKAAIKLCKDLGIDDEVLEKFGEEDGYSIYRVCHYPQFHPLWLESHPPGKSPVPCQADIDEAFEHLGPDRKPGDLLNEFIDKLMDYNAKTRDHVNPSLKGQQYMDDPSIVEGENKGKMSWVGCERIGKM